MKFGRAAFLRLLACAVIAAAVILGARPARAYIVVPVTAVIKQVTLPIPNFHPSLPNYCFAQSVIEVPDVPGVQYYHVTYVHVASGQVAVSTNAPVDIIQVNINGYHGEEHPGPGKHWIPLTGNFGATCGDAASFAADDWTDPTAEAWLPDDPPIAVIRATRSKTSSFDLSFDGGGSIAPASGTNIVKFEWDFGDTKTATGQIVDHTYEHAGTFTVTLKVTDSKNQIDTATLGVAATPALLTLSSGVTNGKIFSVDVSVKNCGKVPLTDTVFKDPQGIFDNGTGDPAVRAEIEHFDGPNPLLPSTLAAGETFVSTVTFYVVREGEVQIQSTVNGTDDTGRYSSGARAQIVIGKRRLKPEELQKIMADTLMDSSQTIGQLLNAAKMRLGMLIAWAASPQGGETAPPWLTTAIGEPTVVPPGVTLEAPPWINTTAGRAMAQDDHVFSFVPDNTNDALLPFLTFADHYATAGGKVIDDSFTGAKHGLKNAVDFYSQLATGSDAFRADALRQFKGLVSETGQATGKTIEIIGLLMAAGEDDPLGKNIDVYQNNPVLQEFQQNANKVIDEQLKSIYDKTAKLAHLAKTDPNGAMAAFGDLLGTELTKMTRDALLLEVGAAGVSRMNGVIEGALPLARTGSKLDASLPTFDPKAAALLGSTDGTANVLARRSLESFGEGATLTPAELEQFGGFYYEDAKKVQQIVKDMKTQYGVDIEIQVRPGNPESLKYYKDGSGVPKPEWIKPKNTEWMDVVLGAPPSTQGKATVFRPVKPTAEKLAPYTEAERQTILARYDKQVELYAESTNPNKGFGKLIADSQKEGGATVTVGVGTGKREITGLKYKLEQVGDSDAYLVIDEAAGGKFVLSDADYQAVVDANTLKHLPADKRTQIELEVTRRFGKDTVSFGGHGYSHSGFDFSQALSKVFIQFVVESSSPGAGKRALEWFIDWGSRHGFDEWMHKIYADAALKLGHPPTNADLLDILLHKFQPGSFVIKFNGTDMRVGYGAALR